VLCRLGTPHVVPRRAATFRGSRGRSGACRARVARGPGSQGRQSNGAVKKKKGREMSVSNNTITTTSTTSTTTTITTTTTNTTNIVVEEAHSDGATELKEEGARD